MKGCWSLVKPWTVFALAGCCILAVLVLRSADIDNWSTAAKQLRKKLPQVIQKEAVDGGFSFTQFSSSTPEATLHTIRRNHSTGQFLYRNTTSRNANEHYMDVWYQGRLGNRMFQYAALYCTARKNGFVPLIKESDEIQRLFPRIDCQVVQDSATTLTKGYKAFYTPHSMTYDTRTANLSNYGSDVRLRGFYNSWKYCHHYRQEIKEQFTFKPVIESKTEAFLKTMQSIHGASLTYIGMHIRRGDFLEPHRIQRGRMIVGGHYTTKTIDYFSKQFSNAIIIVCTDDPTWARRNVKSSTGAVPIVFSPFTAPEEDLCLLSKCNHTIMTTGTFSWWAAWLAGGQAVYVEEFPDPGFALGEHCRREDYYLPQWTPMKAFS